MMNYIANLKGLVLIIALPLKTNSAQLSSELDEHPQYYRALGNSKRRAYKMLP